MKNHPFLLLSLFFLSFLFTSNPLKAQWEKAGGPAGANVQDIIRHQDKIWAATTGGVYSADLEAEEWHYHPDIPRESAVLDLQEHNGMLFAFSRVFDTDDYHYRIHRSANAGLSWQQVSEIPFWYTFSYRLASSAGQLFLLEDAQSFRSSDMGLSWELVSHPTQPEYGRLIAGAQAILSFLSTTGLYISQDGMETWQLWATNPANTLDALPHLLTPYGGLSGAYLGTIWKYEHATGIWEKSDQGLWAPFVSTIKSHGNVLLAKTTGGFFGSVNLGENWNEISAPPHANSDQFELAGDTVYWGAYRLLYVATGYGSSGWDTLATPIGNTYPEFLSVQGQKIVWTTHSGNIFLIDRSTGAIDTVVPPDVSYSSNHFLYILNLTYIYTNNDGDAYRSVDLGLTWTKTLDQSIPGNNSTNKLYHLLGRFFLCTRKGINISADNGLTWSGPATTGLPSYIPFPTNAMTTDGELLFLSLPSLGVFISTDYGQSWQPYNDGLGCKLGFSLAALNGNIFVGSQSAGVWRRAHSLDLLTGTVYRDDNNNAAYDPGETPLPNVLVHISPSDLYQTTLTDGSFGAYGQLATDTLRMIPFTPYATVTPPWYALSQSGATGLDFAVHIQPDVRDLEATLTNVQPFKPGFETSIILTCHNSGTVAQASVVTITLDPQVIYWYSDSIPDTLGSSAILQWHLPLLEPFQSTNLEFNVYVWSNAQDGDTIQVTAAVTPDDLDPTPPNNLAILREVVTTSYDPNDKQVSPAAGISPAQIEAGERLTCTIRFQNTGTAPASFVRILDTLSQNFDIGSIQVLAASHPFTWTLRGANVLEFYFENIQLPDSAQSELNSHGFVKYSITPKAGTALNTVLTNRAFIYFDYNSPVETNTAQTLVQWLVAVHTPASRPGLEIRPNPAASVVQVRRITGGAGRMVIRDAMGKVMWQQEVQAAECSVGVERWPAGVYTVTVEDGGGIQGGILVVQR